MEQKVLSVGQLNDYIKGRLDNDPGLRNIAIRGELSNYKMYPSGHHYFTLKDETGAVKCVMFKSSAARLRFRPENGMKVIAMGSVTVYVRDGVYQLYCTGLILDGVGDLYAAFEQLKSKLAAQGLFDPAHKKPLPKLPGTIGIITSSAGAAVHDMLRILRKRYPHIRLELVLPCPTQTRGWPREDTLLYEQILSQANSHRYISQQYWNGVLQLRNRALVESSDVCIAYLRSSRGGAAFTAALALRKGLELINLYDHF